MKKTQNRKILAALKDLNDGMTQTEVARKYGIVQGTLSKWKAKYGLSMENVPSGNENIPCSNQNIPSLVPDSEIPPEGGWFNGIFYDPIDPDYDYDDEADALLKEYFKTHVENDVSGIYFDENGKLKLKLK
jgi:hypothetical protein